MKSTEDGAVLVPALCTKVVAATTVATAIAAWTQAAATRK